MKKTNQPVHDLALRVIDGDRRALAQAITLSESERSDHRLQSAQLQDLIINHTGASRRIGISGVPGVGKSTFIESFGLYAIQQGLSIAVLAIDPSSPKSGGAILGDKTRMEELSRHPNAFIRPSPSQGVLGGVARKTAEVTQLCEAAGFDLIVIETVGVGQSETAVSELTDLFLLLLSPGTGDELQGIKKGIVELADLLIINKADGELANAAERARSEYNSALSYGRTNTDDWLPRVLKCSALEKIGLEDIWQAIEDFYQLQTASGLLASKRNDQALNRMWADIEVLMMNVIKHNPDTKLLLNQLSTDVEAHKTSPAMAAQKILNHYFK